MPCITVSNFYLAVMPNSMAGVEYIITYQQYRQECLPASSSRQALATLFHSVNISAAQRERKLDLTTLHGNHKQEIKKMYQPIAVWNP